MRPMKRRWRLLVCLALLLLVGASLLHPAVHWRLIGWARGEAFYRNRPTSWWAGHIRHTYVVVPSVSTGLEDLEQRTPTDWLAMKSQSTLALVGEWLGRPPPAFDIHPPLVGGDAACLPILLDLVKHRDPEVRWVAVSGLAGQPRTEAVHRALGEASLDDDRSVRREAAFALRQSFGVGTRNNP